MRGILLAATALLTAAAPAPPKLPTPNDIVAAAPSSAWKTIPADDLLVIDLSNGGRVIVQLAPVFAAVHVANIKALARGGYWSGAGVYRLQDDYVAQWGLNDSNKPWPAGVKPKPPAEYRRALKGLRVTPLGSPDPYAPAAGFADGWPVAYSAKAGWANLAHCYDSVGVARDLAPDTGTGGELYAVIGHAPRQLDRNIALVGRVIEGIDRLSSLPRGTEALGFYKDKAQYAPIVSIRVASDMPVTGRPAYQVMDTASPSFAKYLKLRANRHDAFYEVAARGVDLCNVQVPVRKQNPLP
jgi:peptidylprolyl isomerase